MKNYKGKKKEVLKNEKLKNKFNINNKTKFKFGFWFWDEPMPHIEEILEKENISFYVYKDLIDKTPNWNRKEKEQIKFLFKNDNNLFN